MPYFGLHTCFCTHNLQVVDRLCRKWFNLYNYYKSGEFIKIFNMPKIHESPQTSISNVQSRIFALLKTLVKNSSSSVGETDKTRNRMG